MDNKSTVVAPGSPSELIEPGDPSMQALLTLAPCGPLAFLAHAHQTNRNQSLFGGQLIAQALMAAQATVPARRPHALHLHFQGPSRATQPVRYEVEATRDSGSLSTRRVVASQGAVLLHGIASFGTEELGHDHQQTWQAEPPAPEGLPDLAELTRRFGAYVGEHGSGRLRSYAQVEVRPIDAETHLLISPGPPTSRFWIRARLDRHADEAIRRGALAYLSDYLLVNAALIPHAAELPSRRLFVASLNHALWFHHACDPSDWLLHEVTSPWAHGAHALLQGRFYTRDGTLVASTAQEALVRPLVDKAPG
jgi:acyl-CoA thioesterase-2